MKAQWQLNNFFFATAIAVSGAILLALIDDNRGLSWPANVIRNWQEFGLFNLRGQLVDNPGGYQAATCPHIYHGMSPVCLYPVYWVTQMFSWTGLDTLAFHTMLLLAVLWGSWNLLGRDDFALLVAAVAVLCPGYMQYSKILDPDAISVLAVIPYTAIALVILKKPKFTPALAVVLFVLTVGFMSLNWTTAWVCGPCIFLFIGMRGINRRALIFLIAVMVIGVPLVVATLLAAKAGYRGLTGLGGMRLAQILGAYMWGNYGYNWGLKAGRDLLRVAFINGVGLFPLWLVLVYAVVRRIRDGARLPWLAFMPLLLAVADPTIMRNYFASDPWEGGPVLLVGSMFSLALLRVPTIERDKGAGQVSHGFTWALGMLCFVYALAVLAFFRTSQAQVLNLAQLVREHTARSDTIVIVRNVDVATARVADRLDRLLDRHVTVVDDVKGLTAEKDHRTILSAVPLNNSLILIAQSTAHPHSGLKKVTDWFKRSIAPRANRPELSDTYFLYGPI